MGKCGELINRFEIVGYDVHTVPRGQSTYRDCIRESGHEGPHLIETLDGKYIAWEVNLCSAGECEDCDSEDPTDACLVYVEVTSKAEIEKYLNTPMFNGKE